MEYLTTRCGLGTVTALQYAIILTLQAVQLRLEAVVLRFTADECVCFWSMRFDVFLDLV